MPWRPQVQVITDGEQVSAATTNRPLGQLVDRTEHLKQQVANLSPSAGRVVYPSAPCDSSVSLHDFVYFDPADGIYKQAIAEAAFNGIEYKATPRSFAVGWVIAKPSATLADILLGGRINLDTEGINPDTLVDDPLNDPFESGRYYLSSRVPGKMTRFEKAPLIQLGFFSETESVVQPIQRDLFDSHKHYTFDLHARPSASQNFDRTGWTNFGDVNPATGRKWVDYYNEGSAATPPDMILCVRANSNEKTPEDEPVRVEIFVDDANANALTAEIFESVDVNDPTSGVSGGTSVLTYPAYGEWVAIPNTNLEVAFVNYTGSYLNSLETDMTGMVAAQRFKVLLPHDYRGWTNANPFDVLSVPTNAMYRYVVEGQSDLFGVFPPAPPASSEISQNGVALKFGEDYSVNEFGIYWFPSKVDLTYTYSPWPHDFSADTTLTPDPLLAKNFRMDFIKAGLSNSASVVQSLRGIAPIKITICPTGLPGSAGHLQVGVDLSLLLGTDAPTNPDTVLRTVDGTTFKLGYVVSEIEQGPGIKVERLTTTTGKNVGKLRISGQAMKFESEFDSIALRNAKQEVGDFASWIEFLPPETAACGIIASAKVPNLDWDPSGTNFKLQVRGRFFGSQSVAVSGIVQQAVFKATYHVLRADAAFNVAAFTDVNAALIQHWLVQFQPGYSANAMLPDEIPYDSTDTDLYELNSTTVLPGSLVALNGGFKVGDVILVRIDRVASDGSGNADSYPGRVALPSLRWMLL